MLNISSIVHTSLWFSAGPLFTTLEIDKVVAIPTSSPTPIYAELLNYCRSHTEGKCISLHLEAGEIKL
jgi:hypothetical protein